MRGARLVRCRRIDAEILEHAQRGSVSALERRRHPEDGRTHLMRQPRRVAMRYYVLRREPPALGLGARSQIGELLFAHEARCFHRLLAERRRKMGLIASESAGSVHGPISAAARALAAAPRRSPHRSRRKIPSWIEICVLTARGKGAHTPRARGSAGASRAVRRERAIAMDARPGPRGAALECQWAEPEPPVSCEGKSWI